MKLKCPACGKIVVRDGRTRWMKSGNGFRQLCDATGKIVKMRKVK